MRVADNGVPVLYDEEQVTVTVTQSLNATANVFKQGFSVTLSPNPVQDNLRLVFAKKIKDVSVKITDVSGNVLYNKMINTFNGNTLEMNVSGLSAGTYFVTMESAASRQTLRFVKLN